MGLFGGGNGDDVQIQVNLDAVKAIEEVEKIQAKIEALGKSSGDNSEKVKLLEDALKGLTKEADKARADVDKLNEKGLTLGNVLGGMRAGLNVAGQAAIYAGTGLLAVSGIASALIVKFAEAGNSLADVRDNFKALGGSSEAIDEANKRILGILPNIELYRLANAGLIAEIPNFNKNFGAIADYGVKVGDSLGLTATQGIEKVTQALISGRDVALKQVGIFIDSDKAAKDYAKQMGIVGRELTESEKKYANQLAATDALLRKNQELGEHTDNVVTALESVGSSLTDQIGIMGLAVNENEGLTKAIRTFEGVIDGLDLTEFTTNLTDLAGEFAQVGADAVVAGVDMVNNFARGLRIVGELVDQTGKALEPLINSYVVMGKVMIGQLPTMDELKGIYSSFGKIELPSFQKAVEKVNAEMAEKNEISKVAIAEAKGEQEGIKAKAQALKLAGDEQDKYNETLEANKEKEKERLEALKKSEEALKSLRGELEDLNSESGFDSISVQLQNALTVGDDALASKLKDALRENVKEGIIRGLEDAGGSFNNESAPIVEDIATVKVDKQLAEINQKVQESKFNFWQTVLGGALDAETLEKSKSLAETTAGIFENAIADAITRGLNEGFNSETLRQMGASFGQALGSAYFGPIGGAVGGVLGDKIVGDVAEIGTSQNSSIKGVGTAIDTIFPGIGTALANIVSAGIGGSTTANEDALMGLDRWIEEKLATAQQSGTGTALNISGIDTGSFMGGGNWSDDFWSSFDERAVTSFSGLGEGLTQIAGVTEDVGGQLGYILANNLNGNLDQARMLLIEMGVGAQDLEEAFLSIGLTGEQSWHTVETYMQSIGDLTGEGLIGIGDLEGAMNQFINSGGRGQEALISLRNIGIEAMESGATSMDDLRNHLIATGKFTTEQISALMGGFAQRGITSLQDIKEASDRTLGGVTADAESLGFAWSDSIGQGLADSIDDVEKLKSVISDLPDTIEKNITLKVKTEYSGDDAKALYSDLRNNVGVARE